MSAERVELGFGESWSGNAAMDAVLQDIVVERERQIEIGWSREHDDEHGHMHLLWLARIRLAAAYGTFTLRGTLIKCAALIVAAIESIDRQSEDSRSRS